MDPRMLAPDANALLAEEQMSPGPMMHGRMAPRMGQPGPMLTDPRQPAGMPQPPMRQPAPPVRATPMGGPPMPGAEALGAPTAPPQATTGAPAGRPGARAPQALTPEQTHDAMRNMLQSKYQEMGIDVDDARLDELTHFAMAKRQGRLAKQMGKKSKAALAKYFGALVARDTAEQSFAEKSQSLQSSIASAIADKDEEKQMHYRDQLAAAKTHMEGKRHLASGYRKVIESRYKVDPKYLENPVSLFAFLNDDTDDDFNDLMGDDDPTTP